MRIRYLSDLHFEFHADGGRSFLASLPDVPADLVVLAGDIAVGEGIPPALDLLCERFAGVPIAYVHGNHEFYGHAREEVHTLTRTACARHADLHWLDCDTAEIGGVRVLGATLWFSRPGEAARYKALMTDFQVIRDFESWVYDDNARALAFLERELRPGCVVVTHHLPVRASVAPQFKDGPLNPFFLCDVEPLVHEREPALWIHGHTHASIDAKVGATRVVCNPFGYAVAEENPRFRDDAAVEI